MTWPKIETRSIVAILSTALFASAYLLPWLVSMPRGADNYIGQMQGALITQWAAIMSWYFGSSKGAADTRASLSQALDKLPDARP
jgi:hypothetical protein